MPNLAIAEVQPINGPIVGIGLLGNAKLSRQGGTSASGSSGGGGWQIVDRALGRAATEWLDYNPLVMSMTCIIGGEPGGGSVEDGITTIENYEKPAFLSSPPQPPVVSVYGPVPHADLLWVVSRLEWTGGEDGAIRGPDFQRTSQLFTIELTEYSPSSVTISNLSPAQQAQQAAASLGLG